MALFVVRHAHAGERSSWDGDDRFRPLSPVGFAQAEGIAGAIAPRRPVRIVSSPAVRCVQTVEPLATRLGGGVEIDDRLFEGTSSQPLASFVKENADSDVALCTHGDIVPLLLELLMADGMRAEDDLVWEKASTWVVERTATGWGTGRYLAPPDEG